MRKLENRELGRISVENFRKADKTPIVVVLDNVRSAFNVGSVFRTADAFRIEKIYLCGITASPPNKEIRKSALGSTNSVEWEKVNETDQIILLLKEKGYTVLAIEQAQGSTLLNEYSYKDTPIAVVFGNEVKGVTQSAINLCDDCVEIPQIGTKHSLNISVSAGIVLWNLWRKINE